MKELREFIRTPENGPYKGHFIVAVKRYGNVCLYKHRDYEDRRKVFGYYVFELSEGHSSDNLPESFQYCKTRSNAYDRFNKLITGPQKPLGDLIDPGVIFSNKSRLLIEHREGDYCIAKLYVPRATRTAGYVLFKVMRTRLGYEKLPATKKLKRYASLAGAMNALAIVKMQLVKEQQDADEFDALVKAHKERIEEHRECMKLLRSNKRLKITITPKKTE
jgi:hypothetical protein